MAINFATSKTIDTVNFVRSSHHTVLLFDKVSNSSVTGFDTGDFSITKENFKNLFYKYNGVFNFCLDTDIQTILGSRSKLSEWIKSTGTGIALTTPIQYFNVVDDLVSLWVNDTSVAKTDWSSSSYINIISSLLTVNDWTTLNFSSVLTYQEILTLFNQNDLLSGNKLQLSIIVDNANTASKPIEIILNFIIT
jgi:hypothetical protein